MAEFYLDFEKPIAELRNKLRELSEISTAHPGDAMANCVKMLERQLDETIRNTYANGPMHWTTSNAFLRTLWNSTATAALLTTKPLWAVLPASTVRW